MNKETELVGEEFDKQVARRKDYRGEGKYSYKNYYKEYYAKNPDKYAEHLARMRQYHRKRAMAKPVLKIMERFTLPAFIDKDTPEVPAPLTEAERKLLKEYLDATA